MRYTDNSEESAVVEVVHLRAVIVDDWSPAYLIWPPSHDPVAVTYNIDPDWTSNTVIEVSLTIYDGYGSPVRHLLADEYDEQEDRFYSLREPGEQEEVWDGTPDSGYYYGGVVPVGVYPYQIHVQTPSDVCSDVYRYDKNSSFLTIA